MRKIDWVWAITIFINFLALIIWIKAVLVQIEIIDKKIQALELIENRIDSKFFHLPDDHKRIEAMRTKTHFMSQDIDDIKENIERIWTTLRPIDRKLNPEKYDYDTGEY